MMSRRALALGLVSVAGIAAAVVLLQAEVSAWWSVWTLTLATICAGSLCNKE